MGTLTPARTYNQSHYRRNHNGRRRISIYWTWSYPWEAQRDPAALYNRFSTMTEVRNAAWPSYETPEYDEAHFLQGIAGTLELFHRSTLAFQQLVGETTSHPVAVFQRIDQAGYQLPIDERVLADTDTLMVFGLDHILSEQEAAPEEIFALESLGFFGFGLAGPATESGRTGMDSPGLVVNSSGGLVARGHPLAATGLAQVVELATQFRGRAGDRQVAGARLGVAVNTGGIIYGDAGFVGIHAVRSGSTA